MSISALNWAFNATGMKSSQKLLLITLANYADEEGLCYPSIETLMKKACLSNKAVIANIRKLEELGFIEKRIRGAFGGGRRSNIYLLKINESEHSTLLAKVNIRGVQSEHSRTEPLLNHQLKEKSKPKKKVFQKPTPQEARDYALSIDFDLDGQYFCDYNASRGWIVGKTPMKCWKATIRTWKRNNANQPQRRKSKSEIAADAIFGERQEFNPLGLGQAECEIWPTLDFPVAGPEIAADGKNGMADNIETVYSQAGGGGHRVMDGCMAAVSDGFGSPMQAHSCSSPALSIIAIPRDLKTDRT